MTSQPGLQVLTVSVAGDCWYRPSLPLRASQAEPHYSVPRNNTRVEPDLGRGGEERQDRNDKTPTNEAGRELSVERVGCSCDPANNQLM